MGLNSEFEETIGRYDQAKYPQVANFLRLQQAAIQMFITATGAPGSLLGVEGQVNLPTDLTLTLPRIHAEKDLVFTLQDLEDPKKTKGLLEALYKNQFGENLGRSQVRSLNAVLRGSNHYSSGDNLQIDGITLDIMRLDENHLRDLRDVGRLSKEIFVTATHPLRKALESTRLLPENSLKPT